MLFTYIFVYMFKLAIAVQTVRPNGLKFFEGIPCSYLKFHGTTPALQLFIYIIKLIYICIYVSYSWPNGWVKFFFKTVFLFHRTGQRQTFQLVSHILKLSYIDFQPVSNFLKEITFLLISHFIKFIIHKIYSSSRSKNILI